MEMEMCPREYYFEPGFPLVAFLLLWFLLSSKEYRRLYNIRMVQSIYLCYHMVCNAFRHFPPLFLISSMAKVCYCALNECERTHIRNVCIRKYRHSHQSVTRYPSCLRHFIINIGSHIFQVVVIMTLNYIIAYYKLYNI